MLRSIQLARIEFFGNPLKKDLTQFLSLKKYVTKYVRKKKRIERSRQIATKTLKQIKKKTGNPCVMTMKMALTSKSSTTTSKLVIRELAVIEKIKTEDILFLTRS